MINGYKCGPCPAGYTGDGMNCSRIDGRKLENNFDCEILNPLGIFWGQLL